MRRERQRSDEWMARTSRIPPMVVLMKVAFKSLELVTSTPLKIVSNFSGFIVGMRTTLQPAPY